MIHGPLGWAHVLSAGITLLAGLWIFLRPKGGSAHRCLGYIYAVAMLTMLATALSIYQLTGSFNPLHGFAILSTLQLGRGLFHAVARWPKRTWLDMHYVWMSWSYIGLCAALVAESATRVLIPYLRDKYGLRSFGWFWALVGIASVVVVGVGQALMRRNRKLVKGFMH